LLVYNSCVASFEYKLIRKKGFTANASINISGDKGIVVRAPFWMPKGMIDSFVSEKSEWIEKHLRNLNAKKVVKLYEDGEKHLYFGKEYTLAIIPKSTPGRCVVNIVEENLQIEVFEGLPKTEHAAKIKEALLYWYLEKGIEAITERVNFYSKEIGVNYQKIHLKKVSSIWGSCSPTNCLSFNRKLIMAPHEVVDYVIIHEVSHMIHRNHGHGFWSLVGNFDPQYKKHRQWLKLNHHLLVI